MRAPPPKARSATRPSPSNSLKPSAPQGSAQLHGGMWLLSDSGGARSGQPLQPAGAEMATPADAKGWQALLSLQFQMEAKPAGCLALTPLG